MEFSLKIQFFVNFQKIKRAHPYYLPIHALFLGGESRRRREKKENGESRKYKKDVR